MKKGIAILVCLVGFILYGFSQTEKHITDFKLLNIDGSYISLRDYPKAKGL